MIVPDLRGFREVQQEEEPKVDFFDNLSVTYARFRGAVSALYRTYELPEPLEFDHVGILDTILHLDFQFDLDNQDKLPAIKKLLERHLVEEYWTDLECRRLFLLLVEDDSSFLMAKPLEDMPRYLVTRHEKIAAWRLGK